jgi:hypothetical protein
LEERESPTKIPRRKSNDEFERDAVGIVNSSDTHLPVGANTKSQLPSSGDHNRLLTGIQGPCPSNQQAARIRHRVSLQSTS